MEIVLGILIGFMAGVVLTIRYLRHELAGRLEARLAHIEQQLHNLRAETNLDAATRLAALNDLIDDRRARV
jgi:hypothetical protein